MPKLKSAVPKYRHHVASGQALVHLDGRDIYLGTHGSESSRAEYRRRIAEWLSHNRQLTSESAGPAADDLTINELFEKYWAWASTYYVKEDKPTGEQQAIRYSMKHLCELYGRSHVREFGPIALRTVREEMVKAGWCRPLINRRVKSIRRMFKWGVSHELVDPTVLQRLQAVEPLVKGRTAAPEPEPVMPVSDAHVSAVLPCVLPAVKVMIQLQRLTGMRPNEVCRLKASEIDRNTTPWVYRPSHHKTEHHNRERTIAFGPNARKLLAPLLAGNPIEFVFSPRRAMADVHAKRRAERKTPMTPSQSQRHCKRSPKKAPGDRYTTGSYGKAIAKACVRAGVPIWGPNRLRHTRATEIRKDYGLDAARIVLGHTSPEITKVYAEPDVQKVLEIMEKIG